MGVNSVPKISVELEDKPKYRATFIGHQAASLLTSADRILALKHLTTSAHILLSRTTVLKVLSLLSMTPNYAVLISCLKLIVLTDVTKLVRLMVLVAMNRVEVSSIKDFQEIPHHQITKNFTQLVSNLSFAANSCLHHLSISIAALAQSEVKSSNMVIDICSKDLMKYALGAPIPKYSFAVIQSLVNILSAYGGCSLLNIPKEEAINQISENEQPLKLVNSLAAFVLSNKVDRSNYKQWAAQQLYKCLATKFQVTAGNTLCIFY